MIFAQEKQGDVAAKGDIAAIGSLLLGAPVIKILPVPGGGNNRLYKVIHGDGVAALKVYAKSSDGEFDRLSAEYEAFQFLWNQGIRSVPQPIAYDNAAGIAVFEWIDGSIIEAPATEDIEQALNFALDLKRLSSRPDARKIRMAREACLSADELIRQVKLRFDRLDDLASPFPALRKFLDHDFKPVFGPSVDHIGQAYALDKWSTCKDINVTARTLSPSDFGFHNALKEINGRIRFLDFEYFGWDDPVRLVADFILHPGMNLTAEHKRLFVEKSKQSHGTDHTFERRLDVLLPMIGLRWCLILLNEFVPDHWARRALAGHTDPNDAQNRQLFKASKMLERVSGAL